VLPVDLKTIRIKKPEEMNMILGQSHFIKTVEDVHEAIINTVPQAKFGVAFCEASGPCLVRYSGTDENLVRIAKENAYELSAGHSFMVFMEGMFPLNVLNAIKSVPEVCHIFCATANDVQVVVADNDEGRAILGVIDGQRSKGIEKPQDIEKRKGFLRSIGYKF
jgi:hypothetical protein